MRTGSLLRLCVATLFVVFFAFLGVDANAANANLFVPLPADRLAAVSPTQGEKTRKLKQNPTTASLQLILVDLGVLKESTVTLSLGDDGIARAKRRSVARRTPTDYTWIGELPETGGQAVFVVKNGDLTGHIQSGLNTFAVTPLGGGLHALVKVDQTKFPPDDAAPPLKVPRKSGNNAPRAPPSRQAAVAADPIQVDVFIAWTIGARTAFGGDMAALARLSVDVANTAYARSNANVVMSLVGTMEVNYGDTGFDQSLSDLRNAVGAMADVHTQRNATGADIVSLFINDSAYCGLGYLQSDASYAFSAVYYTCSASNYSFAHEVGHNFGAHHDPFVETGTWPYAYGHGYVSPSNTWRTIMAYGNQCNGCARLGYFSNPNVLYGGAPMGTAAVSDNARVHRERVSTIAAFKTPPTLPPPALVAPGTAAAPGSPVATLTPTFQWQAVTGADGYGLSISKFNGSTYDPLFTSQTEVGSPLTGTSYVLPGGKLQDGGQYRWNMSSHKNAAYGTANAGPYYFHVDLSLPANDSFANAATLALDVAVNGNNAGATKESGEPSHAGNSGGSSVWWRLTPAASGQVIVSTAGSNFNTLLGVYTGSAVNTLTTVASNDDSGGGSTSSVSFNATGGATYYVAVDGFGGATGTISLNATQPPPATFGLSVSVAGSGAVTSSPSGINCPGDCAADYVDSTSVALTAAPAAGWGFGGWSGACSGVGACNVSMSQARSVTATFTQLATYALSVNVSGSGAVTSAPIGINCPGDCGEDYFDGASVTLSAAPNTGWKFDGWGGACTGTGSCTAAMTKARSVTASFSVAPVEFRANTHVSGNQSMPAAAGLKGGGYIVTWQSMGQDGSGLGVFGQRYDALHARAGGEFRINSHTANNQSAPSVARLKGGGFVVAWQSYGQDGSGFGVYGRRYSAAGARVGSAFRVNSKAFNSQAAPSVAGLSGGGFVVIWQSLNQDGSGYGVYGQRFSAAGAKVDSEFRINSYVNDAQQAASVAALTDGGFVVAWQSKGQDGSGYGVYGQRYSAAGAKAGGEFRVNTYAGGAQLAPAVAGLKDGGFVVTWQSSGQDGSGFGVYGRRYTAAGAKAGGEFRVNKHVAGGQSAPSIAGLSGGGFVVIWQSNGQDGSGYGVYGQRFDAAGVKSGAEFRSNLQVNNSQATPAVVATDDGGFAAVWRSDGQDGSGAGVFGRMHP